ncbi:MAG: Mg2 transporter protein CorA family protein magnesium transporter [Parcubacteria group bacterium]|nr:Mg2 transporter protein CorA family protein magnesium transporter [Parcubacteria group bacterium]
MLKTQTIRGAQWIDVESPTAADFDSVVSHTGIDSQALADMLAPSIRHKIEFGEKHAYLIFHFPAFKDSSTDDAAYELDFIIGENYIVTVHYEKVDLFDELTETNFSDDNISPRNSVFFGLIDILLSNFEEKLVEIDHRLRDVEKHMFSGKENRTIFDLSEIVRHLVDFKKITAVYPEIFASLEEKGISTFGKEFSELARMTGERFTKLHEKLTMLSETSHDLRETNNSLLSTKQNASMKNLTIVTIVASVIMGSILVWIELFLK